MIRPILAALALSAAPAFAQDATTVVATVNGEAITLGQMVAMKDSLDEQAKAGLDDAGLWNLMLDQMVRQAAVAQEGAKAVTPRDTAVMELERRGYLSTAALQRVAETEPTEDELKAAYDKAFGASVTPKTEYNAAHILVATEDEAKAIVTQLEGGADFGTIAEEKSSDNSSANKGDLGWFTPDQMVEPFANAVVALEKGKVSAPVQSQFGWHVIKLIDERTQAAPAFDEVRDELATQVRRDRVAAEIERIAAAAKVEKTEGLDPALLGSTDITKN
ncbi:peptidylprolyl isomerase [Paracoccus marinus]|uniref:peptidylprolyl isomerase n=1 Tax=Paracoccus marinus TaxID=288426 RepID=UPI00103EE31A|nr:peptidylprolyl isomerase [Paracoccus marinus]GLS80003.1 peptidylprolyl isomerase [Paracoccus marinus]